MSGCSACQTASAPLASSFSSLAETDRHADERPVLAALDVDGLARLAAALDVGLVDPPEVGAGRCRGCPASSACGRRSAARACRAAESPRGRRSRRGATCRRRASACVSGLGQKKPRPLTRMRPIIAVIISRLMPSPVPVNQIAGSPRRRIVRRCASQGPVALAQALAHDLRHGVHREGQEEEQRRRQEEHAIQRAAVRRLGDLDGDVRGQRAEAVERSTSPGSACCRSPSARSSSRRRRGRSRP